MSVKEKVRDLKADLLSYLQHGFEDDPECGSECAAELGAMFDEEPQKVYDLLKELEAEGKVYESHRWRTKDHTYYEFTPIHKGFKWE